MATVDHLAGMLQPGEAVLAALSAPGPTVTQKLGEERVWWQVAFTDRRFIVARLQQFGVTGQWNCVSRVGVTREAVRISRFPRTLQAPARLHIDGCGPTIQVLDIDRPEYFPQVDPFLAAYGGPVGGAGSVVMSEGDVQFAQAQDRTWLLALAALFGIGVVGCCGFSCLGAVARALLSWQG
jgi:hypothetical protein